MKAELDYKKDIIDVGKMLHSQGYIAATDGNISIRISPDRILTTASGVSKGFLREEHIVVVDSKGNLLFGAHKPSSEIKMHLEAYRVRPDIKAIVHAHPPTCTAFTIAGVSLAKCILPEVVMTLGIIPTADYATPSTEEVPESIKEFIAKYDAVILDRHGAITVSCKDVFDAFYKLEKIEHTAEITLKARQLGRVKTLTEEQIGKLTSIANIPHDKLCSSKCVNCGACGQRDVASNSKTRDASPKKRDASPNSEQRDASPDSKQRDASPDSKQCDVESDSTPDSKTLKELIREEIMKELGNMRS